MYLVWGRDHSTFNPLTSIDAYTVVILTFAGSEMAFNLFFLAVFGPPPKVPLMKKHRALLKATSFFLGWYTPETSLVDSLQATPPEETQITGVHVSHCKDFFSSLLRFEEELVGSKFGHIYLLFCHAPMRLMTH